MPSTRTSANTNTSANTRTNTCSRWPLALACCAGLGLGAAAPAQAQPVASPPATPVASTPVVQFDSPLGGWRYSERQAGEFIQPVHYPAAGVNASRASGAALIAGHIRQTAKAGGRPAAGVAPPSQSADAASGRRMARLVVDGVALPLEVQPGGQFARPWSFGPGAHAVTVRPAEGGSRSSQFVEANSGRTATDLRVVLSWDSDMTDLDLHVLSPSGEHVFYANRLSNSGGALDVDVTTGYGPEIFAHPRPEPGVWQVWVNYFGSGDASQDLTVAQVAVLEHEGTAREKQTVLRVPLRNPGELTLVRSFVVGGPPQR